MVGASLLWVGWFGFNAGSALVLRRRCRHGDAGDASVGGHRHPGVDGDRMGQVRQAQPGGRRHRHHRGPCHHHARRRLCRARSAAVLLGAAASGVCYMAVHAGQARHGRGRRAGRAGRAWRGRRAGHACCCRSLALLGGGRSALHHHALASSSASRRKAWCGGRLWSAVATFVITKFAGLIGGPARGPRA